LQVAHANGDILAMQKSPDQRGFFVHQLRMV